MKMRENYKKCEECNNNMYQTKIDIELKCGEKKLLVKDVEVYRCELCDNEIITDEEFEMLENLFEKVPKEVDILNLEETADLLRVSNQTIYNMIKANKIKAYKIGREWRFMRSDIQAYLNENSSLVLAAKGGKVSKDDIKIIEEIIAEEENE